MLTTAQLEQMSRFELIEEVRRLQGELDKATVAQTAAERRGGIVIEAHGPVIVTTTGFAAVDGMVSSSTP